MAAIASQRLTTKRMLKTGDFFADRVSFCRFRRRLPFGYCFQHGFWVAGGHTKLRAHFISLLIPISGDYRISSIQNATITCLIEHCLL